MERLPKRHEVDPAHTWNLELIYPNLEAWESDAAKVTALIPKLLGFEGRLGESGGTLLEALSARDEIHMLIQQVYVFARMARDQDNGNSTYQALADRAATLYARVSAAGAYQSPEILALPAGTLDRFLTEEPGLQLYRHELEDLAREREHVRTAEVEALLAEMAEVTAAPQAIFGMLDNADMKFPMVRDEAGNEVELTKGRFSRFMDSQDRTVREGAFKALYSTYAKFRNTLGATYARSVKKDIFVARARKYPSARAAGLAGANIPESVYNNLVATVNRNLPTLHRYVQLRRRLLGLDQLHLYDLYVPMVAEVDKKVPYAEAVETILASLAPLGDEYIEVARDGLGAARWVDIYENEGKTSGAYSSGTYTTQPYILMNYQDNLDSMYTLSHELGHSMHSDLTRRHQPFVYGGYTIFVAEVASTFNENLLTDYLLKKTNDRKLRMYLINHSLEGIRTTLIRQTMFAEFEHIAHQRAEANVALTPDLLGEIHYGLNQKYYGTEGMVVDEEIALEWSRIPHFYRPFYVYQYATGLSAAISLSQQVLSEGKPAVNRYLTFLKRGGSDYSINLLKDAGVDMASPEPVQQAMDRFATLLDQLEELVG